MIRFPLERLCAGRTECAGEELRYFQISEIGDACQAKKAKKLMIGFRPLRAGRQGAGVTPTLSLYFIPNPADGILLSAS